MEKYQTYAEYKDSGVEWLGEIPSHWHVVKLSYKLKLLSGDGITALEIEDTGTYPVFGGNGLRGFTEKFNCNGDYALIGRQGALCGNINVAKGKFFATEHAVVVYPYEKFNLKFLSEFLRFMDLGQYSVSAAQPGIAVDRINTLPIAIPTLEEQNHIGNFLDHETTKIDHLIEKQQQLIELLKEKRQAVISHAVTKGLDSNVPMKDSGVEWLGQVPEHWEVSKFGYISQVVRGGSPRPAGDPTLFNGDYSPWVTVAEITKDDELYLTSTETFLTKKGSEQCRVFKAGTLLLSNSGATLGVPKILCIDANANDGVVGFEQLQLDIEFAYYYLSILTNDLRERVKQGSGQPNLNTDIVKNISIAIPPVNEIQSIVTEIKQQVEKFINLIKKAELQIQLMQERRTALISAAVTGKIDVRNWQAPTVTEAETEFSA